MKKNWIVRIILLIGAITAGVGSGYVYWLKPYTLPTVGNLTREQYGIDFSNERSVMKHANESSTDKLNEPKDITESNSPFAYFLSLQMIGSTDSLTQGTGIAFLMETVKENPENLVYSNELRKQMVAQGNSDQLLTFLQNIKSDAPQLKLQTALVYIDELQNPDLGTASLGQKSALSIQLLNDILDKHPNYWLARYARGLNNLYWPYGLKRTDKAIQDLEYCLAAAKQLNDRSFTMWPLIYTAYGDALIKNGQIKNGIKVWEEGYAAFPNDPDLKARANKTEDEAYGIVTRERGVDAFQRPDPSISDLSLLWKGDE
jgi:tetratricopeptide (TPR) repeat protein